MRIVMALCTVISISFPGLSSFALLEREGGKMRDPGNEVVIEVLLGSLFAWQEQ